ncbi:hypothetical protein HK405_011882 [Cladochytrium tenue]|nr:hypothetical protein HK405_011882 [Cladochytrium tenue]
MEHLWRGGSLAATAAALAITAGACAVAAAAINPHSPLPSGLLAQAPILPPLPATPPILSGHANGPPWRSASSAWTRAAPIDPAFVVDSGHFEPHTHHDTPGYALHIRRQLSQQPHATNGSNPAAQCDPNVEQLFGYLETPLGFLFFWLFESRSYPDRNPLMLWLNGGPGASSALGMLMELGPCNAVVGKPDTVEWNPFAWNSAANVIFLDQPADVGYSFSKPGRAAADTETAARDVDAFLQLLLRHFPKYAAVPFHAFGESYGGRYVPAIASHILDQNRRNRNNPFRVQVNLASAGDCYPVTDTIGDMLNRADVQAYLGVNITYLPMNFDLNTRFLYTGDMGRSSGPHIAHLLENGVDVLMYAGDADYVVRNWYSVEGFLDELAWSGSGDFRDSRELPFVIPGDSGIVGMFRTAFAASATAAADDHIATSSGPAADAAREPEPRKARLTFLRLFEAGHMVPTDQPRVALYMIWSWLFGFAF